MTENNEPFPVDETIHVVDGRTIYKTQKWWCAVLLANTFGHDKIMIYQWLSKDGKWTRKQKFTVNSVKDWNSIRTAIDEFIPKLEKGV